MTNLIVLAVRDEIVAANEKFMEAFDAKDAARLAELYTENAKLMPPNVDFAVGRPAIRSVFQYFMDLGIQHIQLDTDEVDACGETAIEVSRFSLVGPDQQVLDQGKYIVVWKMVHGDWKLHRDIFNSSLPHSM